MKRTTGGGAMKHQIAMFKFTLGPQQSIGPAQLHALWAHACQSPNVSVGRQEDRSTGRATYALYATQALDDLAQVERRLRDALEHNKLRASLIPLHAL
jgi:hypothetical protein